MPPLYLIQQNTKIRIRNLQPVSGLSGKNPLRGHRQADCAAWGSDYLKNHQIPLVKSGKMGIMQARRNLRTPP
jgi:hypothetical protein